MLRQRVLFYKDVITNSGVVRLYLVHTGKEGTRQTFLYANSEVIYEFATLREGIMVYTSIADDLTSGADVKRPTRCRFTYESEIRARVKLKLSLVDTE